MAVATRRGRAWDRAWDGAWDRAWDGAQRELQAGQRASLSAASSSLSLEPPSSSPRWELCFSLSCSLPPIFFVPLDLVPSVWFELLALCLYP